jgi:Periplasmic binding proteins and sugar binding domain of LacI family
LLFNPTSPETARQPADAQEAARALGLELLVLNASTDGDIDQAFATLLQRGAGALVIGSDVFYASRLDYRRENLAAASGTAPTSQFRRIRHANHGP